MSYFSFKERSIPQLFLIAFGCLGIFNICARLLTEGMRDPWEVGTILVFIGCIWSGTIPKKEQEESKFDNSYDDILDSDR